MSGRKECSMRVLILGNGGREHALAWRFSKSKRISGLFVAPGNAGTSSVAKNLPGISPTDTQSVLTACAEHKINIVFVGPEAPLAAGIVDALTERGIPTVGPHREAARLESSKAFAKEFMLRHGVPTARAQAFSDAATLRNYLQHATGRLVVKKSGLASGKGVLDSDNREALIAFAEAMISDDQVVVEEYLSGYEVSIFVLTDGEGYLTLPPCADYKKAGVGNTGPNTGGMGAVCPVPWLEPEAAQRIESEVVEPSIRGLREEGLSYKGILYIGLMITDTGPKVLEYNVRFGDPETQALLPLIKSDFGNLTAAILEGNVAGFPLHTSDQFALGVVVAAAGYPGDYPKGLPIYSLPTPAENEGIVFHASTEQTEASVVTGGGRCFTAVGLGKGLLEARSNAYRLANAITFDGAWFRPDIGNRIFGQ